MAEDIKPVLHQSFVWNAQGAREETNKLYDKLVEKTASSINWYAEKKTWPARVAQACRGAAVVFTVLGGLCPILQTAFGQPKIGTYTLSFTNAGYLVLALAAAAVLVNQYGGFSTAWVRYIKTHLRLDAMLQQFQLEWQMACAKVDLDAQMPPSQKITELMTRLQQFAAAVSAQVENETQEWAVEFQQSFTMLEKAASQQKDSEKTVTQQKAGSIAVTLTNFEELKGADAVYLLLDGAPMLKVKESSTTITPVPPGSHDVAVRALLNEKLVVDSKAATVDAGVTAAVSLTAKET
jgi:hypothetical protein